jgi:hypothetical protein
MDDLIRIVTDMHSRFLWSGIASSYLAWSPKQQFTLRGPDGKRSAGKKGQPQCRWGIRKGKICIVLGRDGSKKGGDRVMLSRMLII